MDVYGYVVSAFCIPAPYSAESVRVQDCINFGSQTLSQKMRASSKKSKNTSKCACSNIWRFSKIGLPQNEWFIMENPSVNGWFRVPPWIGNLHGNSACRNSPPAVTIHPFSAPLVDSATPGPWDPKDLRKSSPCQVCLKNHQPLRPPVMIHLNKKTGYGRN